MIKLRLEITDDDFEDGDVVTVAYEAAQKDGRDCQELGLLLGGVLNSARDHIRGHLEDIVSGIQATLHQKLDIGQDNAKLLAIVSAVRPLYHARAEILQAMPLDSQMRRDWLKLLDTVNVYWNVQPPLSDI